MKTPIALYIADTHLHENTLEINNKIFTQVFELAEHLGIVTIIHDGDIFTSRKGQPQIVLTTFKKILDDAAKRGLKIYSIPGNHDKVDGNSDESILDVFDGHPAFTVLGVGAAMGHENIDIFFLPYYDEQLTYPSKLKDVVKLIEKDRVNILITHVGINGVKSNGGVLIDNNVTQHMFRPFKYVLVGHYHDRQVLDKNIFYTGSAYQANFGEDDKKGCVIIYDDPIETLEWIELDFPKFITITVVPDDIDSELIKMVTEKSTEAKIRIKISGDMSEEIKPMLVQLQEVSKVQFSKDSFVPVEVINAKDIVLTTDDIVKTFDDWITERKIEDGNYGRKILKQVI